MIGGCMMGVGRKFARFRDSLEQLLMIHVFHTGNGRNGLKRAKGLF